MAYVPSSDLPSAYLISSDADAVLLDLMGTFVLLDGGTQEIRFAKHVRQIDANVISAPTKAALTNAVELNKDAVVPLVGNIPTVKSAGSPDSVARLLKDIERTTESLPITPARFNLKYEPIVISKSLRTGRLEMFVLSGDAKEIETLRVAVENGDEQAIEKAASNNGTISILVWFPARPADPIKRILHTGTAPFARIVSALEKAKSLPFLHSPVVTVANAYKENGIHAKVANSKTSLPSRNPPPTSTGNAVKAQPSKRPAAPLAVGGVPPRAGVPTMPKSTTAATQRPARPSNITPANNNRTRVTTSATSTAKTTSAVRTGNNTSANKKPKANEAPIHKTLVSSVKNAPVTRPVLVANKAAGAVDTKTSPSKPPEGNQISTVVPKESPEPVLVTNDGDDRRRIGSDVLSNATTPDPIPSSDHNSVEELDDHGDYQRSPERDHELEPNESPQPSSPGASSIISASDQTPMSGTHSKDVSVSDSLHTPRRDITPKDEYPTEPTESSVSPTANDSLPVLPPKIDSPNVGPPTEPSIPPSSNDSLPTSPSNADNSPKVEPPTEPSSSPGALPANTANSPKVEPSKEPSSSPGALPGSTDKNPPGHCPTPSSIQEDRDVVLEGDVPEEFKGPYVPQQVGENGLLDDLEDPPRLKRISMDTDDVERESETEEWNNKSATEDLSEAARKLSLQMIHDASTPLASALASSLVEGVENTIKAAGSTVEYVVDQASKGWDAIVEETKDASKQLNEKMLAMQNRSPIMEDDDGNHAVKYQETDPIIDSVLETVANDSDRVDLALSNGGSEEETHEKDGKRRHEVDEDGFRVAADSHQMRLFLLPPSSTRGTRAPLIPHLSRPLFFELATVPHFNGKCSITDEPSATEYFTNIRSTNYILHTEDISPSVLDGWLAGKKALVT
ncbi:hypothetical protein KIN20_005914 [Parelaphostrongylus tenuis]|uniref:Microtubule-associated protein 1A/B/S-like MBL-like domain-containing protein n=1 Tax=Parelaphostrongylus tenuis TaxID=148309 RepID=A0AAD5QHV8_PARTN|nr:hypothetical protein KIN20_005914 [Parelaphostrongylus tenuis]